MTSINLGPSASAKVHVDSKNLASGICMIAAFGDFNHRKSGHLILHDAKLILEVAHADIVFIPSACIRHSNSEVQDGESRRSVVQYSPGRIFQYIHRGFRTQTEEEKRRMKTTCRKRLACEEGKERFDNIWDLFPTREEINAAAVAGRISLR